MKHLSAQQLREQMESVWNRPGIVQGANLAKWSLDGIALVNSPGEARTPNLGQQAYLRKIRPRDYDKWRIDKTEITCPEWIKERYKQRFPKNWRSLVALYGKSDPCITDDSIFIKRAEEKRAAAGIISAETIDNSENIQGEMTTQTVATPARRKKRAPAVAPAAPVVVPEPVEIAAQTSLGDSGLDFLRRRSGFATVTRDDAPTPIVITDMTARRRAPIVIAQAGGKPAFPEFPDSIKARLAKLGEKLRHMVDNDDLDGLRAFTFPTSSGSRKKLDRYRLSAIVALQAAQKEQTK